MDQVVKECIEAHKTVEGSKGYCWEYRDRKMIMSSGKQSWSKKNHAMTALIHSLKEGLRDRFGFERYKHYIHIKPTIEAMIKEGSLVLKELS